MVHWQPAGLLLQVQTSTTLSPWKFGKRRCLSFQVSAQYSILVHKGTVLTRAKATLPYGTVRVKTTVQTSNGTHQVAHIYFDASYNYTHHNLYDNVKQD